MGKIFEALRKAEKERERILKQGGDPSAAGREEDSEIDPHLVAFFDRMSPISEQYRLLKSAVLAVNPDSPPRTVAVTSAMEGEGKSLTVLNLGMTFAQSEGERAKVVVVDADLRDPSLHRGLGVDNQRGLCDYLAGNVMLELILQRTRHPNLWILPAGRTPSNPAELLSEKRLEDLLSRLARDFTFVLVDTPSLKDCSDAIEVAAKMDGVLLAVKVGETPRGTVFGALDALYEASAKVLGTVGTHLPPLFRGYTHMTRN
jgi:capsular exopolysaccharide synthesis family protein